MEKKTLRTKRFEIYYDELAQGWRFYVYLGNYPIYEGYSVTFQDTINNFKEYINSGKVKII